MTSGYSFGYVAHWSGGDTKLIQDVAERVSACARQILQVAGLAQDERVAA